MTGAGLPGEPPADPPGGPPAGLAAGPPASPPASPPADPAPRRSGLDPLRLAFGTLTAVPIAPPRSVEPPIPGRAMALAPLTGLVPGLAAAVAVWVGLQLDLSPLLLAVISVGLFALTTRGLHLDGLADTADGLAASYDRDRALAVMRRGDTGPAGVAAVVLVLALQVATLSEVLGDAVQRWSDRALAQTSNGEIVVTATRAVTGSYDGADLTDVGPLRAVVVLVVVAVAARVAISLACTRGIGSARPEGLGAMVADSVERRTLGLVLAAVLIACSLGASIAGFTWWSGALAVLIVVAGTAAVIRRAVRRFGGITGDVLGAAVEVGTTAALLALAVAG